MYVFLTYEILNVWTFKMEIGRLTCYFRNPAAKVRRKFIFLGPNIVEPLPNRKQLMQGINGTSFFNIYCRELGSSQMPPNGRFMPHRGYVVYTTGHMTSASLGPQLPVPLDDITLHPGEGVVVRFWPQHVLR